MLRLAARLPLWHSGPRGWHSDGRLKISCDPWDCVNVSLNTPTNSRIIRVEKREGKDQLKPFEMLQAFPFCSGGVEAVRVSCRERVVVRPVCAPDPDWLEPSRSHPRFCWQFDQTLPALLLLLAPAVFPAPVAKGEGREGKTWRKMYEVKRRVRWEWSGVWALRGQQGGGRFALLLSTYCCCGAYGARFTGLPDGKIV